MFDKVLVTGSAGFIGSHIVDELRARKYKVKGFDIHTSNIEDICNPFAVMDAMEGCDAVMHLAAEPYIPYCYQNPRKFFETNANGTLNVLMAAKRKKVKRVVYWSSSEIYGSAQKLPMGEDHPLNPHSTYAVSKLAGDRLCYTFFKEHGLPVTILRQFNCYGPRETQPYVIPEIISQLHKGKTLRLGNVNACRDFTYVEDAASAGVDVLEHKEANGEVINVGSGRTRSIKEIADAIGEVMLMEPDIRVDKDKLRPYDVDVLICDNAKMEKLTGWTPTTGFHDGLVQTVKFFVKNSYRWDYRK